MMKSFFKKLAFVMALAMVVSAMAPAATAKAADAGNILRQEATSWEDIKTTDVLTEGDTQDYKFGGAPSDWRTRGLKWESSKPEFATVDQTGLVKAVAAGETVISVKGEGFEAAMTLTVKAKEPEVVVPAFTITQKSATTAELKFANAADVTTDITVVKVISTVAGDREQAYVLNDAKTKVAGNTVTIEPWVPFGTAKYLVTAAGETVEFNTAVGDPSKATLDYAKPYTYAEAKAPAAKTLVVTDDNDVVITSGYSVYYELVSSTPQGYAYVNGSTGDLYFYADGAKATVKATIRYTVNNVQKSFVVEEEVTAEPMPVANIVPVLDYTAVVPTASLLTDNSIDKTKVDKVVWGANEVKIEDSTAQIVGLVADTDGKTYAINNYSQGTTDANKNLLSASKYTGYTFIFESTDTSKVIVDETTGTLVGVNTTEDGKPAYVLVTMKQGTTTIGIVAAVPVVVQPKKAAAYTTLGANNSAILLTDGEYTQKKDITPETYNQYGEKMADTIKSVTATFNNKTHSLTGVAGATKFTIDAKEVNNFFNVGSDIKSNYFVYTVTMNSGKTADFYLTLKEVTADNSANLTYDLVLDGAEVKVDKLNDTFSISVVSMVLGEKYKAADFHYGTVDASVAAKGDLYVVVRDPSGTVITPATTNALVADKMYEDTPIKTDEAGKKFETKATGVYTVDLYCILDVIDDNGKKVPVYSIIDTDVFSITANLPSAATNIAVDLTKTVSVLSDGTYKLATGAVTCKINNTAIDGSASNVSVNAVSVGTADVFVYGITVKYPVSNGYVEIYVPVNKTFSR